jgi:hypothetical protein
MADSAILSHTNPSPAEPDPAAKASQTPVFMSIINELTTNQDQLQKRQSLMKSHR